MKITEILTEAKATKQRLDPKCWTGYKKQGTKVKGGVRVNNCVKEDDVEESGLQYYTGVKKHGKEYMTKAAQAARDGASQKELGALKDKYSKAYKEEIEELHQEFDMIENIIEEIADRHAVDVDLVWEDLSTLTDEELYVFAVTQPVNEDWQKANKQDKTDGMSRKAVKAYRRENPGSKLKTAVTTKPSKLKKGGKASKRRKSYCSRSRGQMKMHNISCAKTPDKAICKARRRWNC